jgi:hypothetical protein
MTNLDTRERMELVELREFFDRWCQLHQQAKDMRLKNGNLTTLDKQLGATMAQKILDQARIVTEMHRDD